MTSLFTLTLTSSHLIRQSNWLWRYRPFLYHLQRIPRHASIKNLYPSCYHMRIAPQIWLNQRQPCQIICLYQLRRLQIHWQIAHQDIPRHAILTSGWLPVLLDVEKAQWLNMSPKLWTCHILKEMRYIYIDPVIYQTKNAILTKIIIVPPTIKHW